MMAEEEIKNEGQAPKATPEENLKEMATAVEIIEKKEKKKE